MPKISSDETASTASKQVKYKIVNVSLQTVYIHLKNSGSIMLNSRANVDIAEDELSSHVKILARRGNIKLYEVK